MPKEPISAEQQAEEIRRITLPRRNELELFGVVTQLLGAGHIKVMCEDGVERICRITGKMRKRVWMRLNDVVIVKLWEFQKSKGDVVWRYTGVQAEHLRKRGLLKNLADVVV